MPHTTAVYSRRKLYDEIWKEPVQEVAKAYGISDVALAKICRKLNIPRPSRGFWARMKAGHKVEPVALPPLKAGDAEEHRVSRWKAPPPPPISAEEAAFRATPEFHPKRIELPFELVVPAVLERPHSLIARAMKGLRNAKPDREGLVRADGLPVAIGPEQVDRVLRFLDALLKGLERAGHKVMPFKSYSEHARFVVEGIAMEFTIRERLVRGPHVPVKGEYFAPKWDLRPSGDLRFRLDWNREWGSHKEWEESSQLRLETRINHIFQAVLQIPETERALHAERAARARLRLEEEEQRRREEDQRLKEQQRADAVVALARRWREANLVREFAESIRQQSVKRFGAIERGSPAEDWITFAIAVADRIDPTAEMFEGREE